MIDRNCTFEIEVLCAHCNNTLKATVESYTPYINIHVSMCPKCRDAEYEAGWRECEIEHKEMKNA